MASTNAFHSRADNGGSLGFAGVAVLGFPIKKLFFNQHYIMAGRAFVVAKEVFIMETVVF